MNQQNKNISYANQLQKTQDKYNLNTNIISLNQQQQQNSKNQQKLKQITQSAYNQKSYQQSLHNTFDRNIDAKKIKINTVNLNDKSQVGDFNKAIASSSSAQSKNIKEQFAINQNQINSQKERDNNTQTQKLKNQNSNNFDTPQEYRDSLMQSIQNSISESIQKPSSQNHILIVQSENSYQNYFISSQNDDKKNQNPQIIKNDQNLDNGLYNKFHQTANQKNSKLNFEQSKELDSEREMNKKKISINKKKQINIGLKSTQENQNKVINLNKNENYKEFIQTASNNKDKISDIKIIEDKLIDLKNDLYKEIEIIKNRMLFVEAHIQINPLIAQKFSDTEKVTFSNQKQQIKITNDIQNNYTIKDSNFEVTQIDTERKNLFDQDFPLRKSLQQVRSRHENKHEIKQFESKQQQKKIEKKKVNQKNDDNEINLGKSLQKQESWTKRDTKSLARKDKTKDLIELNQKLLKSPIIKYCPQDINLQTQQSKNSINSSREGRNQNNFCYDEQLHSILPQGRIDSEYKNFLENEVKYQLNDLQTNNQKRKNDLEFGTFGAFEKFSLSQGKQLNLLNINNNLSNTQSLQSEQKQSNYIKVSKDNNQVDLQQLVIKQQFQNFEINQAIYSNRNNFLMNNISQTSLSACEIGDQDDFDEKMDQKQYSENKNKSISRIQINQNIENLTNNQSINNSKILISQQNSQSEEDDDGGFLSDEVDEKRSFTPQPRQQSQNRQANQEISINLGNIAVNSISQMNMSKISRINNNTSLTHHIKENQHNKSHLQPYSSIPQLIMNATSQFAITKNENNNSLNSFKQLGNTSSVDNYNQMQGQSNLITSNNNSFISGLQGFAGIATNSIRQNQNQINKNQLTVIDHTNNKQIIYQNIPIKRKVQLQSEQNQHNGKIQTVQSLPLTSRIQNSQQSQQDQHQNIQKLQQRQITNKSNDYQNIVNKSPLKNNGASFNNSQQDKKQVSNNNISFGQALFQNIKELTGFKALDIKNQLINKEQISNVLPDSLMKVNTNSRTQNVGQIAQNLKKTPGTSMGLMTSVKNQNSRLAQPLNPSVNIEMGKSQNSVNNSFYNIMAQKGSKCKCNLKDYSNNEILDINNINVYSRNEQNRNQKQGTLEQNFEEITLTSGSGDGCQFEQENQKILNQKYCSTFCKRVSPKDQRSIILECLKIEMNGIEESQVVLQSDSINEQAYVIKSSVNKLKRYIIDSKWWAKWCDYCNFDQNDILIGQQIQDYQQNGQFDKDKNYNYLSTNSNRKFESAHLYSKPGKIENECLLESRNIQSGIGGSGIENNISSMRGLRQNIFEHYDFEALYPSIWSHLYSWYSADTQIARYLKLDTLNQDENLMGSMGSQTLKQALAMGKLDFKEGQHHMKKMELDLYPSKVNTKMLKNQFLFYEEYNNKNMASSTLTEKQGPVDNKSKSFNENLKEKPQQDQVNDNKDFEQNNYSGSLTKFLGLNKLVKSQQNNNVSEEKNFKDFKDIQKKTVNMQKANKSFVDHKHRPSLKGFNDANPSKHQIMRENK